MRTLTNIAWHYEDRHARADRLAHAAPALRAVGVWSPVCSPRDCVARGVDVTLFATARLGDGRPRWTASARTATPRIPELDGRVWEALHVSHALARSGEFELVHNQLDWLPLAFARALRTRR